MKALYIHIPFCSKVCTYCDFYKMVAKSDLKEKYVDYLIKELEMKKEYLSEIETIYVGGGTPSSLSTNSLNKLFLALKERIDLKNLKEFTVEANPNDINPDFVNLLAAYKVNRVSLGVQSLKSKKLKFLGRTHRKGTVKKAIKYLKEGGITNINADIIFGTQKDKKKIAIKDLKKLLKWEVTHISTYSLQLEEKTILYKKFKENKFIPINENLDSDIYFAICEFLKQKGFIHYEVSNFALNDNYKSVHNLTYWNNDKYLGIGAAASYYIDNIRYTNINNLNKYFEGIDNESLCYLEEDEIVPGEKMFEEVMLGFRKLEGINLQKFEEKFEKTIFDAYPVVNKLIDNGNLEVSNGYIKVPESKIYILNNILINFLDEDLDKAYENKITESAEYDISESIISAEENANE